MTQKTPVIPWPTADQLSKLGLVRCEHEGGCSVFVDPANVPSRRCITHPLRERKPRVPYLPRERNHGREAA